MVVEQKCFKSALVSTKGVLKKKKKASVLLLCRPPLPWPTWVARALLTDARGQQRKPRSIFDVQCKPLVLVCVNQPKGTLIFLAFLNATIRTVKLLFHLVLVSMWTIMRAWYPGCHHCHVFLTAFTLKMCVVAIFSYY